MGDLLWNEGHNHFRRFFVIINILSFEFSGAHIFKLGFFFLFWKFYINVPKVRDLNFGNIDSKFRVYDWSNFGIESSQAAGTVVLASFVDRSFAEKIEGTSNDYNFSVISIMNILTEPGITHMILDFIKI